MIGAIDMENEITIAENFADFLRVFRSMSIDNTSKDIERNMEIDKKITNQNNAIQ